VHLRDDAEAAAFRSQLRQWLAGNLPPAEQMAEQKLSSAHLPDWAKDWQRRLFDNGWLVPGWPPELGGRDATAVQQMIYFEEFSRGQIPRSLNPQGLSICAPSVKDFGTPEQRERWVLPTLRAEITWCLGMSEPGAGSDLAGLSTRAVLDGDSFIVNGQKVWTSGAHHADWCLCFVRTDPNVPKHKGISALIIDMKSAGIACRPLPELTDPGFADFNEVFFTDVVVPKDHLLGPLNGGWPITQGSLGHERAMLWISNANSIDRSIEALVEVAQQSGAAEDEVWRDRLASLYIDAVAIRSLGYRGFAKAARGETSDELPLLKLYSSEVERELYRLGIDALGSHAVDLGMDGPTSENWRGGAWATQYLRSFSATIAGGTSEIQRNIIAERVIGLPRA
jgi:alkylation response protein AidB-like acyl-CoA dehydrogenase